MLGYGSSVKRYSLRELSHLGGTCVETVRREARRGTLQTVKQGQYHYVLPETVSAWLAARPERLANAERALKEARDRGVSLARLRPIPRYQWHLPWRKLGSGT